VAKSSRIFSLLAVKFPIYQLADFLAGFYQPFGRFNRWKNSWPKTCFNSFKLQRTDLESCTTEAMLRSFIAEHCSTA